MAVVTVRFKCGHVGQHSETSDASPRCLACGEVNVVGVQARPPRFVGACRGPLAETKALDAAVVNLAPGGPLRMKAPV